ncbi:MAG: site-specific DNA-methyltransferase, partial [Acidobacteriota bacterium]|nr:site-specific DNA-methyltransferase [Acidobacteriota bacterium]
MANLVIDSREIPQYSVESVLDAVIWGDALEVLPKLPDEMADMVFIDPPYFLQLPQKRLLRWKVKTIVEGVDEDWDKFESFESYDQFIITILKEV